MSPQILTYTDRCYRHPLPYSTNYIVISILVLILIHTACFIKNLDVKYFVSYYADIKRDYSALNYSIFNLKIERSLLKQTLLIQNSTNNNKIIFKCF